MAQDPLWNEGLLTHNQIRVLSWAGERRTGEGQRERQRDSVSRPALKAHHFFRCGIESPTSSFGHKVKQSKALEIFGRAYVYFFRLAFEAICFTGG